MYAALLDWRAQHGGDAIRPRTQTPGGDGGGSKDIAISAATRGLLHGSTLADRAPIFSVIYLLSYSGATIPALIAGRLTSTLSLPQISLGYGALALASALFTVLGARDPQTTTLGNGKTSGSRPIGHRGADRS
ncbi:hypothetical protein [Streptomyces viridochromogenes]|uniref:hypothetical protein n=1 Tax=Streptomyces viridochromogenes TaxID=1938 RepID=UPI001C4E69B6|nr:hypothetical protein [Streptomyces viridochromogenes]